MLKLQQRNKFIFTHFTQESEGKLLFSTLTPRCPGYPTGPCTPGGP